MDYDRVMLYVKSHPDCSSIELADEFGVTIAKAFTFMNFMMAKGLVFKTLVRSPTNNKRILGYRVIPEFDVVSDNADGSMKKAHVVRLLQRNLRSAGMLSALSHMYSMNDWARHNGTTEVMWSEVLTSGGRN